MSRKEKIEALEKEFKGIFTKEKIEALEKEFKGIFTKEDLECYIEDTLDYLISKTITQKGVQI